MEEVHWPPRSPYEALMSSPNGRKKYKEVQERRALRKSHINQLQTERSFDEEQEIPSEEGDDDDDEETLKLRLAAIEARLKLKKLQQSKSKTKLESLAVHDAPSAPPHAHNDTSSCQLNQSAGRRWQEDRHDDIQVPVSPTKKATHACPPVSPRRVQLGIDKGIKGSEISLKRPCRLRPESVKNTKFRKPDYLQDMSHTPNSCLQKPKSFNERIAESRSMDKVKREKEEDSRRKRSSAFVFDKAEMKQYHAAARDVILQPSFEPEYHEKQFSRDDVLRSFHRPGLPVIKSDPGVRSGQKFESVKAQISESESPDNTMFEPFSGVRLSNRILPHSFLTSTIELKTPMRIPYLLKTIKGPDFELPDIDGDYVVFGIIASKSYPRDHKEKTMSTKDKDLDDAGFNNTSKYMVLTLTDLEWSIDLFLFSTAFPRYYKLTPGTVIAILNPGIMPPPPHRIDTNRFSLTLRSSDDTVLEIGRSRDLGFCKSVKKDGTRCDSWIDNRKTEFCEFHINIQLRKTTAKRMEVNGGPSTPGFGGFSGSHKGNFPRNKSKGGLKPEGSQYDWGTRSTFYVTPSASDLSAASLLDAEDFSTPNDLSRRGENQGERLRKRLAQQEHERTVARQLGKSNQGVGSDYILVHHGDKKKSDVIASNDFTGQGNSSLTPTVKSLLSIGLDSKRADNVKLRPPKKRTTDEESHYGQESTNKKTRFVTAHGIKDAGQNSLGGVKGVNNNIDYDDDLDIL